MSPQEAATRVLSIVSNFNAFGYNNFEMSEEPENVPTELKVITALFILRP